MGRPKRDPDDRTPARHFPKFSVCSACGSSRWERLPKNRRGKKGEPMAKSLIEWRRCQSCGHEYPQMPEMIEERDPISGRSRWIQVA